LRERKKEGQEITGKEMEKKKLAIFLIVLSQKVFILKQNRKEDR
jgi:hypothetical protein